MRKYPIIHSGGEYIPFDMMLQYEHRAQLNHHQTIERLAERGGTDWIETLCIIKDKPWGYIKNPTEKDIARVREHVLYLAYKYLMEHDILGERNADNN